MREATKTPHEWALPRSRKVRALIEIAQGQEKIMATLDNLTAAIADLGEDIDKVAADVLAALADLRSQIEALSVGQITQEQIDGLVASLDSVDAKVEELDAAVPDRPVVEPPVEPPVEG